MGSLARRKRIRLPGGAYHDGQAFLITMSTHERYPWFRLHPQLAESAVELLQSLCADRGSALYARCVMPDHVHLLLQDQHVVEFVRLFKGRMTPMAFAREPERRLWQRSFHDHALRKEETLEAVALYLWGNPVRAGLVEDPREYMWSGSGLWPEWRALYGRGQGGRADPETRGSGE
jgi:putative transposase